MIHKKEHANISLTLSLILLVPMIGLAQTVKRLTTVSRNTNSVEQAQALADKGKYPQAIAVCDKLIREKSTQGKAALLLKARCLEYTKDYEEVLACYRRVLRDYPRSSDEEEVKLQTLRLSALELMRPEGLTELERFIADHPNSPGLRQARWWKAGIAYKKRDWEGAAALLESFLKDFPGALEAQKAKECLAQCKTALAEEEANTKKRDAAIVIAQAKKKAAGPARETAVNLNKGRMAFEKGRLREALDLFDGIGKAGPSSEYEPALFELGRVLDQLGETDRALGAWEECLVKGTNDLWKDDCLLAKGRVLMEEKAQDKAAEEAFRNLLATYPDSDLKAEALLRLGLVLALQGRTVEAKAVFMEARKARALGAFDPWNELDRLMLVCGGDDSLWPAKDKLRLEPAMRRETTLADLLFAACDYEKARKAYQRVAEGSKDMECSARAWIQAGRCLNQLRRFDKALACYERFLTSPYDKSVFADGALLRAGVLCVGPLDDSRKGKDFYKRILERYPGSSYAEMAELYLCTLSYWEKDWKVSLPQHEAFVKRYPTSPNAGFVNRERLPAIRAALAQKNNG